MSILSAGQIIKEARQRAGLTQEALSEDICSTVALSKIENGKLGVSPSTFSLLMEKTGSPREVLPTFKNIDDYNCFRLIKETYNDITHHQLDTAYSHIQEIININYADNKFYRQQTMLLYCWLQYSNCYADSQTLLSIIENALRITKPSISVFDIRDISLSYVEYKGFLLIISILIDCKEFDSSVVLLSEINTFIRNFPSQTRNQHNREIEYIHAITYGKYFYFTGDYSNASDWINKALDIYYSENIDAFLSYELFILAELISLKNSNSKEFSPKFEYFIAAATFKKCAFVNRVVDYAQRTFSNASILSRYHVFKKMFPELSFSEMILSDGLYNIYDKDVITIGRLINHLRKTQGISIDKLCNGICSKSMLSKIENNDLSPSIYVIEALLGRLGVNEKDFTFYGNDEETQYYRLKSNIFVSGHLNNIKQLKKSVSEFAAFANKINNKLVLQQAYCFEAQLCEDKNEAYTLLYDAIKLTYIDFNFENINNYILSWSEYNIINGLLKCIYPAPDIFHTHTAFHKLLSNTDKPPLNNKLFSRCHESTICLFLIFLDINKLFNETIFFIDSMNNQLQYFDPYSLNFALYYYALAKANLGQDDSLIFYSKASIGNSYICNDLEIINHFKKDIYKLTNINI
ncbi:helix-turn-helix domain-containing protein [Pseudobutyrivibrio xylanivorans]|uniref:Helix-turn-helix domain-containing protein n=1 Tax=Pseudobutyrivibrio xylanivorans TaxID=185007 RepID=A0A5P6VVA8_PSEXY|nr:helix-turn-helix domain-containing protein [Pseudobutyrivibrio xylanivorans]QFJ54871.1 helix-turn-helix domain-containing protein [Pseudobutyrivibrio xylanivorans]